MLGSGCGTIGRCGLVGLEFHHCGGGALGKCIYTQALPRVRHSSLILLPSSWKTKEEDIRPRPICSVERVPGQPRVHKNPIPERKNHRSNGS